jgi:hypothetical protein
LIQDNEQWHKFAPNKQHHQLLDSNAPNTILLVAYTYLQMLSQVQQNACVSSSKSAVIPNPNNKNKEIKKRAPGATHPLNSELMRRF